VIAHLIEKYYKDNLENAVKRALDDIRGTYGLVVASIKEPDKI
jgi:glucosamine 6-phosphate synthetase-like amidotransferase/phosphosugar isomerase protein